jgi:hypothetical protein
MLHGNPSTRQLDSHFRVAKLAIPINKTDHFAVIAGHPVARFKFRDDPADYARPIPVY